MYSWLRKSACLRVHKPALLCHRSGRNLEAQPATQYPLARVLSGRETAFAQLQAIPADSWA
ncbi:hypothetical protein [Paenibacillus sp. Z3-2]